MKAWTVVLLIGLLGCGADPHRSLTSSGSNAAPLSVSGFVSTVQLTTTATSSGGNSLVTVVTFLPQLPQNTPATTITFCGNVANEFFPNTFATVQFAQKPGCASIVSLTPTTFLSISGLVSIVQVTTLVNTSLVTVVTFLPAPPGGFSETITFCGNVENEFALNTLMTVNFNQQADCSSIVSVVAG